MPDQKVVESDKSVVILCRGTLFEEEVAQCAPKNSARLCHKLECVSGADPVKLTG